MVTTSPCVSIITAAYNAAPFIERTIASVLDQDWTDFEWIVVDDGSSDRTPDRVAAVQDERVRLIRRPNGGPSAARNTGLAEARGQLVALLDHDDVWFPQRLSLLVAALDARPACGFASSNMFIGHPDHPEGAHTILDNPDCCGLGLGDARTWLRGCSFSASTAVVRRTVFECHGGWREDLWYAQDWELVLRFWLRGERAVMLDQPLGWTVIREGQLSRVHDGTHRDREVVLGEAIRSAATSAIAEAARAQLAEWDVAEARRRLAQAMRTAGTDPDEAQALARWALRRPVPLVERVAAAGYATCPRGMDALRRLVGRG